MAAPHCERCQANFTTEGGWRPTPGAPTASEPVVESADASIARDMRALVGTVLSLAFLAFLWTGQAQDKPGGMLIGAVLGAAFVALLRTRRWWLWLLLFSPFAFVGGCTALFAAHFKWG
jgi:hypothetical protein